jgi:regulator of replication initiation timing
MATKKPVVAAQEEYRMPAEVSAWIEYAESRLKYLTTKIQELKEENTKLRLANKTMEIRVMGQSNE